MFDLLDPDEQEAFFDQFLQIVFANSSEAEWEELGDWRDLEE